MRLMTDPLQEAAGSGDLIDRMPQVRGRLTRGSELAKVTWFQVGGPAELMFKPADLADLQDFLAKLPGDVPVTPIGVGSNLLVRDGGLKGVTLRLGREFAGVSVEEGERIRAGASVLDLNLAKAAARAGLAGLEFYSGIPGTVGGALRMNAGAYGTETKDVLVEAVALDRQGRRHVLQASDMGFTYRHAGVPDDWIFIEAVYQGRPGERTEIEARMAEIQASREASQPIRSRTGGSTFKNPEGGKAWQLIDQAGCRGLMIGGAQVSEKHCNFLINTGSASAADLEQLGEEVRRRVQRTSGVELHWEIKRIGEALS